jgi:hypothetical protein
MREKADITQRLQLLTNVDSLASARPALAGLQITAFATDRIV